MEMDENEANPTSEKFYKMKINVLERELAEKTRLLENTSSILADSQKQYQTLLSQFQKLSKENKAKSISYRENKKFDSDFIFEAMKSREANSSMDRPLQQLQDFEDTIKKLSNQMEILKKQNSFYKNEITEWNNFANFIYNKINNIFHYDHEFPINDNEAQRFILDDMIKKIYSHYQNKKKEDNSYKTKYNQAKIKLCEVQKRCDDLVSLLEENGHESHHYKSSKMSKNSNRCQENNPLDNINSFGNHIDQLESIAKQMKNHYATIYKRKE